MTTEDFESFQRGMKQARAYLVRRAAEAMQEPEGTDFGPLTHAERNKLLFGTEGVRD